MELYLGFLLKMIVGLFFMLLIVRVIGRKELSQSTPIDLFFIMMMAELLGGVVHTPEFDWKLVIFVVLSWAGLTWFTQQIANIPSLEKWIKGSPHILIRNGVIDEKVMDRHNLTREEILTQLREQGVFKLSNVKLGVLEISGNITVKKREDDAY